MKKIAFENAVRRCSEAKGIDPPPRVSITEKPCPLSSGDIAHIHIEGRIICIWKKRLEELTLDQIDKVAAHEVAHLISVEHGGKHAQAQAEIEIGIWSHSVGGVVIHGGKKVVPNISDKPKKPVRQKKICHYHSCKKRTELRRCVHCGELFCKEHLKPKYPTLPPFKRRGIVGRIYMEDWRGSGHACPPYYDYLKAKEKEELDKRWKILDILSGRRHRVEPVETGRQIEPVESGLIEPVETGRRVEPVETPVKESRPHRFVISAVLIIAIIIILLTLIWLSPAGF